MVLSKLKLVNLDIRFSVLLLYAFLIPFNQVVSAVVLALCLLISLFKFEKKNVYFGLELLYPILLYLFLITSLIWSDNFETKYFERFSQLIAIPVLFAMNRGVLSLSIRVKLLHSFVFGCALSVLFCEFNATYRAITFVPGYFHAVVQPGHTLLQSMSEGGNLYFGRYFSMFHQTVYYASFLTLAFNILLYKPLNIKWQNIALKFLCVLGVFQVSNRVTLLIFIFLFLVYFIRRHKQWSLGFKGFFLASFIIVLSSVFLNPRMNKMLTNVYESGLTINAKTTTSHGVRLLVWDTAVKVIKKSPLFGYGIGDHYNVLKESYLKNKYLGPFKAELNSHNEFLTLLIQAGILAFLLLLLILYRLKKVKEQDEMFNFTSFSFLSIILFSLLFESMLERYSGILFIVFFYCLFVSNGYEKINNK